MDDVKVSVICNTYNQQDYIRDALQGFVMQKTNFAFEVLVHDDASTDNTPNIIREFEEKYPDIIKPIYQSENQYSKKVGITKTFGISRAKGEYIAFCEGDDYWTDEYKLQKQYDVLQAHPEISMCAHTSNMVKADNVQEVIKRIQPSETERLLEPDEVIIGGGGFISTNSLFYRKSLFENEPPFRQLLRLDYTMQILGSLKGGIYYLPDNMSNYRSMSKGSWTERHTGDPARLVATYVKMIDMLNQLNIDTEYKYNDSVEYAITESQFHIFFAKNNNKELLKKEYRVFYKRFPLKTRIKIRLKAYFPFLLSIKKKFD